MISLDKEHPFLYSGDEIDIGEEAHTVRCPRCELTVAFRGRLEIGSVMELKCFRCKHFIRFAVAEPVAAQPEGGQPEDGQTTNG